MSGGRLEAVTFDCWNTLIQERDADAVRERRFGTLARVARAAGAVTDDESLRAVYASIWDEHVRLWQQRVASGAPEMARWALRALGVESDAGVSELVRGWHAAGLDDGASMLPGADATLARLAGRGVLGVPPARALHVGDLRRTDVAGARGMGMGSIRIRAAFDDASPEPDADHVADSHAHLCLLLELS
jgi:FMN phosphatase YigB (HAD superfamily)